MNNIELNLNRVIDDLLVIINNTKLGTDLIEYYQNLNINEISKDLNKVNMLYENIIYNRSIILGVSIGMEGKNKLEYLYKI